MDTFTITLQIFAGKIQLFQWESTQSGILSEGSELFSYKIPDDIPIETTGFHCDSLPNNCKYYCTESVRERVCLFHLFSATCGRR